MKMKKLLALLLAVLMVVSLLPVGALADDDIPILTYQLNGVTLTADLIEIGTWSPSNYANSKVYLASLPYGSQVTGYAVGEYSTIGTNIGHALFGTNTSAATSLDYLTDSTIMLSNEMFRGEGLNSSTLYAKNVLKELN